ncbi:hypothetical protein K523DRAFT_3172 [Schizophyllum commune Tattone D]|nr:hypothetical protein K523DRAFT_3172 [Schizophyllum commune Tattone D]
MMRDLRRRARRAASSSVDDGMQDRGGKKEGERIFPSSKEAVYAPLPRPGIDGEVLDFEGGGVGVGGFPTLISRQYYYSQRRAPLGTQ